MPPNITSVQLTRAPAELRATGLLYWAKCRVDDRWQLDGLGIRRTARGTTIVTFPSRKDGTGRERPYIAPLDAETRQAVEDALAAALCEHGGER